jgi:HK97 family phage prohead protease
MKHLNLPTEFKSIGETGQFEGYASVFGNIDLGGDVIERGAFKEIVKNPAGKVIVLWQHSQRDPIGVADVKEDDKGLAFKGHLVLEDPLARRAHAHMKAGSLNGMSIGYDVLEGGAQMLQSGIRMLKSIKLWEISAVTFGMNPLAGIDGVKQITTIRDFENFLRDAGGYSKNQAQIIAAGGYKALQIRRDAGEGDEAAQEVISNIQSFLNTL